MLNAALKIVDQNPLVQLGYGSSFPIDRTFNNKEGLKPQIQCGCGTNESRRKILAFAMSSVAATLAKFLWMSVCI
jgi:hypothetical protein